MNALAAARLAGDRPVEFTRLNPGGNSRVWRLTTRGGGDFALKEYYAGDGRARARLRAEFEGLSFLWSRGVRDIPRPVAADNEALVALYDFLPGAPLRPEPSDAEAVMPFAAFAARLFDLSREPGAALLPPASDANLEPGALSGQIAARLARLDAEGRHGPFGQDLGRFLDRELRPFLARFSIAPALSAPRPQAATLSPSDFGFHNALRLPDGGTAFVDFEYFGRDDPAKLIADFLLHPAGALCAGQRRRFAGAMLEVFAGDADLPARLDALFPLVAAKWTLILLNEFTRRDRDRRRFAAAGIRPDRPDPRPGQLEKARDMLDRARGGLQGALS